jgi:hypothetical protein
MVLTLQRIWLDPEFLRVCVGKMSRSGHQMGDGAGGYCGSALCDRKPNIWAKLQGL